MSGVSDNVSVVYISSGNVSNYSAESNVGPNIPNVKNHSDVNVSGSDDNASDGTAESDINEGVIDTTMLVALLGFQSWTDL